MDQRIIDLYDKFTHGAFNRREFLERLAALAGSTAAAMALLPLLGNDYARAATVAETPGAAMADWESWLFKPPQVCLSRFAAARATND